MNRDYLRFSRAVAKLCGLELTGQEKATHIRLAKVMRAFGVSSLTELADAIDQGEDARLIRGVVEALVTTQTQFFGDRLEFERLRLETLPRLHGRRARVWCAGCATGQEAYSLAMTFVEEAPNLMGAEVEILATDISHAALETARHGLYSQFEVQRGLSTMRLLRHFEPHEGAWLVKRDVRSHIVFKELNLLDDFTQLGRFDVIFCRNVLDYFVEETRCDTQARLSSALTESGVLILGSSANDRDCPVTRINPATQSLRRSSATRLLETA